LTNSENGRDSHVRLLSRDEIIVEEKIRQLSQEFSASYRQSEVDPEESKKWLNPYAIENIAIFASYLSVGFGLYFIQAPLQYYMVNDLNSSPAQQSVVMGLLQLPFALKLFCGFLSDSTPIYGKRRKPYFLIGWLIYVVCNIILAILVTPTIAELAVLIFFAGMGFIQADVCTDAMIVERSKKFESIATRGILQANGYIIRFFGSIVGAAFGAILYNQDSWGWGLPIWGIFLFNGFFPLFVITPFYYFLVETVVEEPLGVWVQLKLIWALVQRRAVWRPCAFIFIYNMCILTNPALNSFLVDGLGFSNFDIGLLVLSGTVFAYVAIVVYRKFLFEMSWHTLYIGSTAISALFNIFLLVLVLGVNERIGMGAIQYEILLAMGAFGVIQFIVGIQFLPACRMFIGMCPEGTEGASYAMLTTLSNIAGTLAYSLAGVCADAFQVTTDNLTNHDYSGMWRLTVLCGCVQFTGLLFLPLLPRQIKEQIEMQENDISSPFAGAVFIGVMGSCLLFIFIYTGITVSS